MAKISNKIKDTGEDTSWRSKADIYWTQRGFSKRYIRYRTPAIPRFKETFSNPYSMLLDKFQFKSVEFGNWVSADWRYSYLLACSMGLYDLNKVLGFNYNTGFSKTVGLAFGSRGSGSALAHFEPGTFMINLTRYSRDADPGMRMAEGGVMSLAHEYGHALDYFFAQYVAGGTNALSNGDTTDTRFDWILSGKYHIDKLHLLMHEILKTIIWQENGNGYTKYYAGLREELNEYWYRHNELFARAFEQYVQAKLQKGGIVNRFLTKGKYQNEVYMPAGLFSKVEPKMDALITEMRKRLPSK